MDRKSIVEKGKTYHALIVSLCQEYKTKQTNKNKTSNKVVWGEKVSDL